jgi:5-methylcytosine-specific restriction enzyme A
MNTFLFTWNPTKWVWDDLPQAVYEANLEGKYLGRWSCGGTRKIRVGDRAFLMRLGLVPKGIMGSGVVVSEPFLDLHWDEQRAIHGDKVYRVEILFDVLSDLPILTEKKLTSGSLAQHNWFPQASGTTIPEHIAAVLEDAWSKITGTSCAPVDEQDLPRLRTEGTKRSRLITTYERNPQAREDCIKHYGTTCFACGISFEKHYGSIGKGFTHVHHVIPVSDIKKEYEIDSIADLRPVCQNCHAMIHKRTPPYSIDEIKDMMRASNKLLQATS